MTNKKGYFFSQVHQPFFTLAIINAIGMMLIFLLSYKGVLLLSLSPFTFHAYSLLFTIFTPFFLGFLLTTFPRFSQTQAIAKTQYLTILALLFSGIVLFLIGTFTTIMIASIGAFFILLSQLYPAYIFYTIYKSSTAKDKHDQFWILIAWLAGIVTNVLFIGGFLDIIPSNSLTSNVGIYLYLTLMGLSVAQRMIPFFSHIMIEKNRNLLKMIFILLSLKVLSDVLDLKIGFLFLIISGAILMKEVLRWKLPYKEADAILWILHLAIFWLPTALIIGGFSELAGLIFNKSFLSLTIHLVALGFLSTIMIGFGTRVTIGHSGNQMQIDKVTKVLFYLTQIVVYFRALYSFSGSSMMFDITATLWMVLFVAWSVKYLPLLISGKKLG